MRFLKACSLYQIPKLLYNYFKEFKSVCLRTKSTNSLGFGALEMLATFNDTYQFG